jgi:hypothetical protein
LTRPPSLANPSQHGSFISCARKRLGPDHPDVAASFNNLAQLYTDQGRYADDEPLYTPALGIREKALGPDHPDVTLSLNNLAVLYRDQGRYPKDEDRALALYNVCSRKF